MLGRPVSSAHLVFAPILLALLLLGSHFLTQLIFKGMRHFGDDTPTDQAPTSPAPATAQSHPSKSERPEFPNAGAYVRHELESIIIPVVDLEGATVEEAIDFLRQRSRELSSEPPERAGFSFILRKHRIESGAGNTDVELDAGAGLENPPVDGPTITWQAQNVSLHHVLQEVTRQAGLRMEITTRGLIEITPAVRHPLPELTPVPNPVDPFTGAPDPSTGAPDPFSP